MIAFYDATTEPKLLQARSYLKEESKGILAIDRKFGRGSDVRFKVDSYVLVTFQPDDEQEMHQLAGRSSRTMKRHQCLVLVESPDKDSAQIKNTIRTGKESKEKDGIEIAKIMIGRSLSDAGSDRDLGSLFKKTWMISEAQLKNAMPSIKVADCKKKYEDWKKSIV